MVETSKQTHLTDEFIGFCIKRSELLLFCSGVDIWCYVWSANDWSLLRESNICCTTEYTWDWCIWWCNGAIYTSHIFPWDKI